MTERLPLKCCAEVLFVKKCSEIAICCLAHEHDGKCRAEIPIRNENGQRGLLTVEWKHEFPKGETTVRLGPEQLEATVKDLKEVRRQDLEERRAKLLRGVESAFCLLLLIALAVAMMWFLSRSVG